MRFKNPTFNSQERDNKKSDNLLSQQVTNQPEFKDYRSLVKSVTKKHY